MGSNNPAPQDDSQEVEHLRQQLAEAQDTLHAIGAGQVDAVVVSGPQGEQIFAVMNGLEKRNRALEEQNREMQVVSRMKSEFLANMSHELRSPLNGIIGFSELLCDGKLGPLAERPKEFVGRIHAGAKHLLFLINEVLDLSKLDANRMEFRPERIIVADVIREVIAILDAVASAKKIRIQTDFAPSLRVVTDPERFSQVLYNYLSNALKFTGDGGSVVVRLKAEGAAEFRLEVTDTGIGIQEKDLGWLFTEFRQLDAGSTKHYAGTGLGLAITRRIVEAQGGTVGVESTLGKGSTFFAVLPRVPLRVPAAEGPVADGGHRGAQETECARAVMRIPMGGQHE